MSEWKLNERLKFKNYPYQDERSAYTAGYNDAWFDQPKWTSNMRDYYPAAYSDGYSMGQSDRAPLKSQQCPKCKGLHYKTSPCIVRATKSTAARKDVQRHMAQRAKPEKGTPDCTELANRPQASVRESAAGTQALSVDNSTKRPVGRPKTITDMKAYKAERARKYRADKKAAKSPPPKPSIQTTTEERNE